MRRWEFITMLGGAATSWSLAARAQQAVRPLIGLLSPLSAVAASRNVSAFRSALRDLAQLPACTDDFLRAWRHSNR
jgi:hypothetical protein